MMKKATLRLEDGTCFHGYSFGYDKAVAGEVVFNTAMTGYPESLTDPSYAGQIMVLTYPLVGNYGVPPFTMESATATTASNSSQSQAPTAESSHDSVQQQPSPLPRYMESDRIHATAIVVADYSDDYSHWLAQRSLADWLHDEHIAGITGIDTRSLTKVLRENGVMMGTIVLDDDPDNVPTAQYEGVNWVAKVSCKDVITYSPQAPTVASASNTAATTAVDTDTPAADSQGSEHTPRVVLVDCGVKANIIRCLTRRGVEVVRVPWDYDFNQITFDGLFLANGPGNPDMVVSTVDHIRAFLQSPHVRPCMGICMGNQLLAKAAGATIYKLKYGHRSHNQPVRRVGTNECFITSQNHGYAVDDTTLPSAWEPLFVNMNDGSNEGIRHRHNPWFSAQFHPEACSGPVDTEWLFDQFVAALHGITPTLTRPSL